MNSLKNMFRGTGLCARFTFRQAWKTKSNLWTFLILALTVILMPYLYSMGYDSASSGKVENVYYYNDSDLEAPDLDRISLWGSSYNDMKWQLLSDKKQLPELSDHDLLITMTLADAKPEYSYEGSQSCSLDNYTIETLIYAVNPLVVEKLCAKLGIPAEAASKLGYPEYNGPYVAAEYEDFQKEIAANKAEASSQDPNADSNGNPVNSSSGSSDSVGSADSDDASHDNAVSEEGPDYETVVNLQMAFSILMMMISIMTASYIIREIIAEKSSKLVDLLMVSMKAQALLLGKILGVLAFVLSMMLGIFVIYTGTNVLKEQVFHMAVGNDIFGSFAKSLDVVSADILIVLLVSFVLGILIFSLFAGLMGAGCSTEEDTSQALGLPMILIMGAYIGSIFLTLFTEGNVLPILCLIPVLSSFITPVQYLLGNINIFIVIASVMIQLLIIAGMIYLCGKLYASLMVYRGKRLSLGAMFKMVKSERKEDQ